MLGEWCDCKPVKENPNVIPFRRSRRSPYRRSGWRPYRRGRSQLLTLASIALVAFVALGVDKIGSQFLRLTSSGSQTAAVATGTFERSFSFCSQISRTCVVDGDTIRLDGTKIRIADIDTPELSPPRCDYERELGERAKSRMRDLLNAGPFTLRRADRDEDKYGRKLRTVHGADGRSIGAVLVDEGLARFWDGSRHPWCS